MVRVNRFIALGAILALSMLTAQTTFAGPGGITGDSITVFGSVNGGNETSLWITDPDLGSLNLGEYTYFLQGPSSPAPVYLFCAAWQDGPAQLPVNVTESPDGSHYVWTSQFDASGSPSTVTFGNPATDTPTVMDYDGDGLDDILVVRDNGDALEWIVKEGGGENPVSAVAATFFFGPAGSSPVPGNWDGDATLKDNPGITTEAKENPGNGKLWLWGDVDSDEQVGAYLWGKVGDINLPYTDGGIMRPGIVSKQLEFNVYDLVREFDTIRLAFGNAANTTPVGNCNLNLFP